MLKILCIPRRKKRSLFLLGFAITMATMMAVSMFANIKLQAMENLDSVGDNVVNGHPVESDRYHRVKRMNVVRETLAVEEDYSDNNRGAESNDLNIVKANIDKDGHDNNQRPHSGKILQAIFNYQRNNGDEYVNKENSLSSSEKDMEYNVLQKESNDKVKVTQRNSKEAFPFKEPFRKSLDENGNIVFHIQNTSNSHKRNVSNNKDRTNLVKFNDKNGYKIQTNDDKNDYNSNEDERDYSYQYPNPVFKENDFDQLPKHSTSIKTNSTNKNQDHRSKLFKFLFNNEITGLSSHKGGISNSSSMDNINSTATSYNDGSHAENINNEKYLGEKKRSQALQQNHVNWQNSHQMGVRNNDSKKASQFVFTAAKGNITAESPDSPHRQNLLLGDTGSDHKVKLSQPCGPSESDCNIDNEVPKQASNSIHYQGMSPKVNGSDSLSPKQGEETPLLNQPQKNALLNEAESIATNMALENKQVLDKNNTAINTQLITAINKHQQRGDALSLVHSNIHKHSISNENKQESSQLNNVINMQQDNKIETQIPIQNEIGSLVDLEFPATQLQHPELQQHRVSVRNQEGTPLVVDKIYWSQDAISLVPTGLSEEDFKAFLTNVSHQRIASLERPSWKRCGRPKNQYAVLEGGQKMCARYRDGQTKMVQGEILSFYLSRFLGIDNIPAVVLAEVDSGTAQWERVKDRFGPAHWQQHNIVALIMWIDDLETTSTGYKATTKMPPVLLKAYESNSTLTYHDQTLRNLSANQLSILIQWSDMILFDYITGNYDRVASMQDGAQKENDPNIMHEDMRNLRKNWRTDKLWFIDNESGLLDAYQLIYSYKQPSPFYKFHYQMLTRICIFNQRTVNSIKRLAQFPEPYEILVKYANMQEPLYKKLIPSLEAYDLFRSKFHTRLKEIVEWVNHCQNIL